MSMEQNPTPFDALEALSIYERIRQDQLNLTKTTLIEATTLFAEGYDAVNARLSEAGRSDLAIAEPAIQTEYTRVEDIFERANNFTPNFSMCTGRQETGRTSWSGKPETEPTQPTEAEILALRDLPNIRTFDDIFTIKDSGEFPATQFINHSTKMFFVRGLVLFPEFFSKLVVGISQVQTEPGSPYARYEAELFVAYQILSKLVDTSDLSARKKDGSVDDWRLGR